VAGNAVQAEKIGSFDQPYVAGETFLASETGKCFKPRMDNARAKRLRKVDDNRETRRTLGRRGLGAGALAGVLNGGGARRDIGFAGLRAGDGEHQRRRVAEIAYEIYRAGTVR